eukprot:6027547-Amphidinium_carterae.1
MPSVKLTATELNLIAESSAMAVESLGKYRSLVMRVVCLGLDMAGNMKEPREGIVAWPMCMGLKKHQSASESLWTQIMRRGLAA